MEGLQADECEFLDLISLNSVAAAHPIIFSVLIRRGTWTWTPSRSSRTSFRSAANWQDDFRDRCWRPLARAKATEALDEFAKGFPGRLHRALQTPPVGWVTWSISQPQQASRHGHELYKPLSQKPATALPSSTSARAHLPLSVSCRFWEKPGLRVMGRVFPFCFERKDGTQHLDP